MKKILFLIDSLGSGGAQRQITTLAFLLKEYGMNVEVLSYSKDDFYAPKLKSNAIPILRMIEPNAFMRMYKIRRHIRRNRYDAVISFLETPNFLNDFAAMGKHDWKVITGERSSKDQTFQNKKAKIYLWFQRYSDFIVCNSENAKNKWMAKQPRYEKKLKTIYNVVNLDNIDTIYQPHKEGKLNILVAASHQYLKNAMGLARAIVLLNKEQLSMLRVDWYGSKEISGYGSKAFDEVKAFVESNGLQNTILFHKPTTDLGNRMNEADIVALFSQLEGLPNTICEGMCLGKPIIMSRVSDYNVLVDTSNGFLCDWDNDVSIKEALEQALSLSDEELKAMGRASKEKANKLFSKENIVTQWMSLINK